MEPTAPLSHTPVEPEPTAAVRYEDVDPYVADHRDQLLMQTRWNLMTASQMSDLKANLMLTLSAVMLQFALVKVSESAQQEQVAHYWAIVLGALTTIILSAWSTIPKSPLLMKERPDSGSDKVPFNLLHFTNFIELSLPEFKRHMNHVMSTPPRTHEAILEELHAHGRFISRRKYLPLRLAYLSFLLTWLMVAIIYLAAD
ncbi:MAG: DUF5706 domain-containing protein [Flavobacteriales bacterium]